jgi:hypothetical protein
MPIIYVDPFAGLPWYMNLTFVQVVATLVITIATIVNVWVAWRMGKANQRSAEAAEQSAETARRAVKQTEEELELSNRPYMEIINQGIAPDRENLEFEVANYGNVPLAVTRIVISGGTKGSEIHIVINHVGRAIAPGKASWVSCAITSSDLRDYLNKGPIRFSASFEYKSLATNKEYSVPREYEYSPSSGLIDVGTTMS